MTKASVVLQVNLDKKENKGVRASKETWEKKEIEVFLVHLENLENLDLKVPRAVKGQGVKLDH